VEIDGGFGMIIELFDPLAYYCTSEILIIVKIGFSATDVD